MDDVHYFALHDHVGAPDQICQTDLPYVLGRQWRGTDYAEEQCKRKRTTDHAPHSCQGPAAGDRWNGLRRYRSQLMRRDPAPS